jgi:hypothetical protein
MALVMSGIALAACGSSDRAKLGNRVEDSAMITPNYQPGIITAFADKAYLVRQVAADQGAQYDETPVSGKDLITFSFRNLDVVRAELHWYEATGIGRREMKIKTFT